eukprot:1160532-Pelagomonas_calceolata.AAC.4
MSRAPSSKPPTAPPTCSLTTRTSPTTMTMTPSPHSPTSPSCSPPLSSRAAAVPGTAGDPQNRVCAPQRTMSSPASRYRRSCARIRNVDCDFYQRWTTPMYR